jgi:hypothetical protein
MRKLALLLLVMVFALALPAVAATFENVLIRNGDQSFMDGNSDDMDVSGLGRHYAYFERNGVAYAIRDTATLGRLSKLLEPQRALGREQARVGEQQAALGQKQAALGAKQAALGAEQVDARGAHARELARRQEELADRQRELADQQQPLAAEQRRLAGRQREAARIARPQLEKIFEEAIRSGVAQRR